MQKLSQDRILRLFQLTALLMSCLVVVVFLRFHLNSLARDFRADFERQNFIELGRGETFILARKLAALERSGQLSCVVARKGGILFFEESRSGTCGVGIFRVVERVKEPNQGIEIEFTLGLSNGLFWGLIAFFVVQATLAATVVFSQTRIQFLRHEHEFELAAMARQVAHDVQSPLAILRAIDPGGGKWSREGTDLYRRAMVRLRALVEHLQGEGLNRDAGASLSEVLLCAVHEKEAEVGGSKISLVWRQPIGLARLPGDSFEWGRVFSNLLNNALESYETGSPKVEISVEQRSDNAACINIADTGRGISADVLPRLGLQGFSLGKSGGRGLGLFIAKRFVESVKGRIEIESQFGVGTTVKIHVPIFQAKVVILLDDDRELASAWKLIAEKRGLQLLYFSSPVDLLMAAEGMSRETPVYLDLEMGENKSGTLAAGERLSKMGFAQLFICTGRPQNSVEKPDWAISIVGKNPPWI